MLVKKLDREWFDKIKCGMKLYEGRVNTGDWANVKEGDIIQFYCGQSSMRVLISEILHFKNFESALEVYGNLTLPGRRRDEWITIYNQWYSSSLIEANGVILLRLEVIFD